MKWKIEFIEADEISLLGYGSVTIKTNDAKKMKPCMEIEIMNVKSSLTCSSVCSWLIPCPYESL